ncbi:MAG TPA: FecR family protein [Caulifigura sp.]|nr:FecR family protein [Caulifigura sp.]
MSNQDEFVARFLEGQLSDEELAEASDLLADAALADRIVRNSMVHDLLLTAESELQDASGDAAPLELKGRIESTPPGQQPLFARMLSTRARAAVACLVVAVASLLVFRQLTENAVVAKISRSVNAAWETGDKRWSVGDTLRTGDQFRMQAGRCELTFDDGTVIVLDGEVSLTMISATAVSLERGAATTRVESSESGVFHVLTPSADVVDLGTEFGVRVLDDGKTDVVVFEGSVDLRPSKSGRDATSYQGRLLFGGEAVQSTSGGAWEPLISLTDDTFPSIRRLYPVAKTRPPVILGVSDNRPASDAPKFYRICHEGLVEDARAFVDKTYEWNGLTEEGMPAFLRGADYIQTYNSDRKHSTLNIKVELSGPAMLYVLYDNRMIIPDWLSAEFEDTGLDIGLDEEQGTLKAVRSPIVVGPGKGIDQVCSIWARRVDRAGTAEIGPIGPLRPELPWNLGRTMLGIAAQPLPSQATGTATSFTIVAGR